MSANLTDNQIFELNAKHPAVANEMMEFCKIATGEDVRPSIFHASAIMTPDRTLQFANRMNVTIKKGQTPFDALMEQGDRRGVIGEYVVVIDEEEK